MYFEEQIRAGFQSLWCSLIDRRCVFCDAEVCAFHPNGNPFIGTTYREALIRAKALSIIVMDDGTMVSPPPVEASHPLDYETEVRK